MNFHVYYSPQTNSLLILSEDHFTILEFLNRYKHINLTFLGAL